MDPEFLALANESREIVTSRYNSAVEIRKCEICGSQKDLETHHIQHQSAAKNGFVESGTHVHRASNLTVLCDYCHGCHHAGKIVIKGWVTTSLGRTLEWYKTELSPAQSREDPLDTNTRTILQRLIAKKTKEKDMCVALAAELGREIKIAELRQWKKMLA